MLEYYGEDVPPISLRYLITLYKAAPMAAPTDKNTPTTLGPSKPSAYAIITIPPIHSTTASNWKMKLKSSSVGAGNNRFKNSTSNVMNGKSMLRKLR